jgi:hypothetical protein
MQRLLASAGLALFAAATLAAQTSAPQTQPQTSKEKIVTVTGCLRNGEEPGTFVLSNLKWKDNTDRPTGTSGTTAADEKGTSGATLRLVGSAVATQLSEHVGHSVELTGVIIDEPDQPAPPPNRNDRSPAPSTASQSGKPQQLQRPAPDSPQTLNVRTVKMIEENCTGR